MTKKTYGQTVTDVLAKENLDDDVIEYRRMMEPDIINDITKTVAASKNHPLYAHQDFYVVVLFKNERIASMQPRTFIFARRSCPTPHYKQAVWKYYHTSGELEFLWVIPDVHMCNWIIRNPAQINSETRMLEGFVSTFFSGEMDTFVKKENGEKKDMVIHVKKEIIQ